MTDVVPSRFKGRYTKLDFGYGHLFNRWSFQEIYHKTNL